MLREYYIKYMPDANIDQKDPYFVAVKVFLERDGKFLVMKDNFGQWDLPGGRIKKDEFAVPLEDIVKRKMFEEVGESVEYVLGKPIVFMRHERVEHAPGNPTVRIFALGYQAAWQSGEVVFSERHTELLWADPATFKPEDYFTGGWLKGIQEYMALKKQG
jgi:8-oxo-dGTP pyrophosphatase MutT (NUDIX family)